MTSDRTPLKDNPAASPGKVAAMATGLVAVLGVVGWEVTHVLNPSPAAAPVQSGSATPATSGSGVGSGSGSAALPGASQISPTLRDAQQADVTPFPAASPQAAGAGAAPADSGSGAGKAAQGDAVLAPDANPFDRHGRPAPGAVARAAGGVDL